MPYRDSQHHEVEILMSFNYLKVFKTNEHTEYYHIREPNDENVLFKIGDKNYSCGGKIFTSETNDTNLNYSSELGFNDIKIPYAYGGENNYFMLHQKYNRLQEYKFSTLKNKYQYLYKKRNENKGVVECGNDSINCKINSDINSY